MNLFRKSKIKENLMNILLEFILNVEVNIKMKIQIYFKKKISLMQELYQ